GRGGGGGGFGGFNPQALIQRAFHGSWALISFELETSDEQLIELRKVYQKADGESKDKLAEIGDVDPNNRREVMQGLMQGLMEGQRELVAATKAHLNDDQAAKLDDWYKEQANAAQRFGEGRGSRERGGGGGEGGEGRQRRQRDD
ncbi:hypothetical protein HOK31_10170, partial [Candidatus Poribacteria bacterium]|nr:hypothetical protein [Candidatus Poribacteria bacterium]